MNYYLFLKNGGYLYIFTLPFFYYQYYLLGFIFFLKTFPANYYHTFKNLYKYPNLYQFKHFIRFTDTGHYAALLLYYNHNYIPISHNITFVITFMFWTAKYFFNMTDDTINHPDIITIMHKIHSILNHSIYYLFSLYYCLNNKNVTFDNNSLFYSYIWVFSWLFFIYIPWFYLTNDYVYSVLQPNNKYRIYILLFALYMVYLSNEFGKLITNL